MANVLGSSWLPFTIIQRPAECKEASRRDVAAQRQVQWSPQATRTMAAELAETVRHLLPGSDELAQRVNLIRWLNQELLSNMPGSFLEPFGSFAMGLATGSADLDLSLEMPLESGGALQRGKGGEWAGADGNPPAREESQALLRNVTKKLYWLQREQRVEHVVPIYRAAVPVVKFRDVESGVECDISIANRNGVFKSRFIGLVTRIDARFRDLCILVKAWARNAGVNDSKCGTLNSLSFKLLVALHLQTRSPPILPPFSSLLAPSAAEGGQVAGMGRRQVERCLELCEASISRVIGQGRARDNSASTGELLASFFVQLAALESLWEQDLCASTFHGCWITRKWDLPRQRGAMRVEDFADHSQNCARSVRPDGFKKICAAVREAATRLSRPPSLQGDAERLCLELLGPSNRAHKRRAVSPLATHSVKRRATSPSVSHSAKQSWLESLPSVVATVAGPPMAGARPAQHGWAHSRVEPQSANQRSPPRRVELQELLASQASQQFRVQYQAQHPGGLLPLPVAIASRDLTRPPHTNRAYPAAGRHLDASFLGEVASRGERGLVGSGSIPAYFDAAERPSDVRDRPDRGRSFAASAWQGHVSGLGLAGRGPRIAIGAPPAFGMQAAANGAEGQAAHHPLDLQPSFPHFQVQHRPYHSQLALPSSQAHRGSHPSELRRPGSHPPQVLPPRQLAGQGGGPHRFVAVPANGGPWMWMERR